MRPEPKPAKPRRRDTLRELAAGVDSRGLGRLLQQEAPQALRRLFGQRGEGEDGRSKFRRFFSDVKGVLIGLSRRLSPPRRALFLFAVATTALGVFDIELSMGERILVDSSPLWFLIAVSALTLLLALELVDRLRVRDEIEVARTLQRDLLPRQIVPPRGWRVSHQFRTANEIGGDYYTFLPLEDGRLAFAIGDASGHGIGAGLLMAIAAVSLEAALELDPTPHAALAAFNRVLCRTGGSRAFMSLFIGLLDPLTGQLDWANAGHPYPLLRRGSGEVIELGQGSLPLGLRKKERWGAHRTHLRPGDLLLLYSDGIPEAHSAQGDFGFERLRVEVERGGQPEHLHARIWRELEKHQGEESLRDDATLVVLGRDPLPSSPPSPPPGPPTPPPPPLPILPPLPGAPPPLPR